jgi:hypothetical protein
MDHAFVVGKTLVQDATIRHEGGQGQLLPAMLLVPIDVDLLHADHVGRLVTLFGLLEEIGGPGSR